MQKRFTYSIKKQKLLLQTSKIHRAGNEKVPRFFSVLYIRTYYVCSFRFLSEFLKRDCALGESLAKWLNENGREDLVKVTIAQRWGDSWAERIASRAERFLACGWLCRSGSRVAVPVDKFLISDSVIAELFE